MAQGPMSDERIEQIIGNLLRAGVLAAAGVVLAGAVLLLVQHGNEPVDYEHFRSEPPGLRNLRGIAAAAFRFDARAVIQFGILILLATPVARVAFSVFAFAIQRDRLYVLVTLVVLGILIYSLGGFGWAAELLMNRQP